MNGGLDAFTSAGGAAPLANMFVGEVSAPTSRGTFRTDGPTFSVLLIGVVILTAGLELLPALMLGPIAEGFRH